MFFVVFIVPKWEEKLESLTQAIKIQQINFGATPLAGS